MEKLRIVFDKKAIKKGKVTAENVKAVMGVVGDTTWTEFDYGHTASGVATDGNKIVGLFYASKKQKTKKDGFGVYNSGKKAEYLDETSQNTELVQNLVEKGKIQEVTFNDMLKVAKGKKTLDEILG